MKFMFLLQTYNKVILRSTNLNVFTCFEEQFIIARVYNGKILVICVNYVVIGSCCHGWKKGVYNIICYSRYMITKLYQKHILDKLSFTTYKMVENSQ